MSIESLIRNTGRLTGYLAPSLAASIAESLATRPRRALRPRRQSDQARGEWVTFRYGLKAKRWGNAGPVVLALHGWEGHPDQFRSMGIQLAEKGYRFYALAGPGHIPGTGSEADPALFAAALHEARAEFDDVAAVIGHSMGAGALLWALREGLNSERAVLVAGSAGFRSVLERTATRVGLPTEASQRFLGRMARRTGHALSDADAEHLLPAVYQPLLIVHDKHDSIIPYSDATTLMQHAQRASHLATEGLGHNRVLADASVVEAVEGFLRA
jgi:pimeloyl-ACP methyl ester carboxylesterase